MSNEIPARARRINRRLAELVGKDRPHLLLIIDPPEDDVGEAGFEILGNHSAGDLAFAIRAIAEAAASMPFDEGCPCCDDRRQLLAALRIAEPPRGNA